MLLQLCNRLLCVRVYRGFDLSNLIEIVAELGMDSTKIVTFGVSGCADLAASTRFLSRKRQTEMPLAHMFNIPGLDSRDPYPSWKQSEQGTLWHGAATGQAWNDMFGFDDSEDEIKCAG